MPRRKKPETREELDIEIDRSKKELHYYENQEKILQHRISELSRKERTNRLCTRAGMLEKFLEKEYVLDEEGKRIRLPSGEWKAIRSGLNI